MPDTKQSFKVKFFSRNRSELSFYDLLPNKAGIVSIDSSGLVLSRFGDGKEYINTTWDNITISGDLLYIAQIEIRQTNSRFLGFLPIPNRYAVNFVPKTDEERQRFLEIAKRHGARIYYPTELERKIIRSVWIGIFLFLAIVYMGVFFVWWKYR